MLSAQNASQDFITSICHFICLSVRDEMKNSTAVEIALIPSSQDQDSDLLDQIFGFDPESHASVSCPHCGSLVSYFSDLEFHNCSGEF